MSLGKWGRWLLLVPMVALQARDVDLANTDLLDSRLSLSLNNHLPAFSNIALIQQWGDSQVAMVSQRGFDNGALIEQQGVNNFAELNQQGNGNNAQISQYGRDNFASVSQQGDNNLAVINQYGGAYFSVQQIGNDAIVIISQY